MYCTRYILLERFIFIATDICSGIQKEGFEELSFCELDQKSWADSFHISVLKHMKRKLSKHNQIRDFYP